MKKEYYRPTIKIVNVAPIKMFHASVTVNSYSKGWTQTFGGDEE